MATKAESTGSAKPTEAEQQWVKKLIDTKGIVEAARIVGCARETLMRVAAGLGVHRGTLALVKAKLSSNET